LSATGHDRDQRLVLVRLTDEGRRLLTDSLTALSANSARLKDHLPPGHLDRIQQMSGELVVALEHRLAEVRQP
jgi:DNA-binding MarR family transcriptional regulator